MGKQEVVNLYTEYIPLIHGPSIKDANGKSVPLYSVDDKYRFDINKHENFVYNKDVLNEACKKAYNSPCNIKRLFISELGVVTEYFTPYLTNKTGKFEPYSGGNWVLRKTSNSLKAALDEYQKAVESGASLRDISYTRDMQYRIIGDLLATLKNSWLAVNVEEIYIDGTFLFSNTLNQFISESIPVNVRKTGTVTPLASLGNKKAVENLICQSFKIASISDLESKFPRLRIVGIIPTLKTIVSSQEKDRIISKIVTGNMKQEHKVNFYETLTGKLDSSKMLIIKTSRAGKTNTEPLTTRSYYVFDREVLSRYSSSLQAEQRQEQAKQLELRKKPFEKSLDTIKSEAGEKAMFACIKIASAQLGNEELADIKSNMVNNNYITNLDRILREV